MARIYLLFITKPVDTFENITDLVPCSLRLITRCIYCRFMRARCVFKRRAPKKKTKDSRARDVFRKCKCTFYIDRFVYAGGPAAGAMHSVIIRVRRGIANRVAATKTCGLLNNSPCLNLAHRPRMWRILDSAHVQLNRHQ